MATEVVAAMPEQLFLFLGAATATGWLLRKTARRVERNRRSAHETALAASSEHHPPAGFGAWQVEMHELVRDLRAELDSKARVLQILLDQSRREADRLERLLTRTGETQAPNRGAAPRPEDDRDERRPFPSREFAAGSENHGPPPPSVGDVFRLANEGQAANAIARTLGRPEGEVELVLSMREAGSPVA